MKPVMGESGHLRYILYRYALIYGMTFLDSFQLQ
jgi:hypothetical protein